MILLASMLKLQHFHIDSTATTARITTYSLLINTIQNQNRELFMLTHTMIWAGRFGAKKKLIRLHTTHWHTDIFARLIMQPY